MRWTMFSLLTVAAIAVNSLSARADEKPKPKGKGDKAESSGQTIDLNNLPPDLQKQVLKALESNKAKPNKEADTKKLPPGQAKKQGNKPKDKQAAPAKGKQAQLPPGLRNKSPNHPGVVAYLKAHSGQSQKKDEAPQKPKPKGKGRGEE